MIPGNRDSAIMIVNRIVSYQPARPPCVVVENGMESPGLFDYITKCDPDPDPSSKFCFYPIDGRRFFVLLRE